MKKIAIIVLLIFTAPSAFSQEIQLEQYKGKVVYLDFWASWCGPCKKSFPWMNQLKKELDPNSFVIVAVNLDKEKNLADEFLKENHAEFDIVFDPQAVNAKKFKVKGMPSSYLIDQSGKVIGSHVGFREEEAPAMKQRIIKLIKEGKMKYLILVVLLTSACSSLGVEPWERDLLAKPGMELNHDPVEMSLDEHIYFSKEASSGGQGFGGGGCGCN